SRPASRIRARAASALSSQATATAPGRMRSRTRTGRDIGPVLPAGSLPAQTSRSTTAETPAHTAAARPRARPRHGAPLVSSRGVPTPPRGPRARGTTTLSRTRDVMEPSVPDSGAFLAPYLYQVNRILSLACGRGRGGGIGDRGSGSAWLRLHCPVPWAGVGAA